MLELYYEIDLKKEKYPFNIYQLSKEIKSDYIDELIKINNFRMELNPIFYNGKDIDIFKYTTICIHNTVASISKIDIDENSGKINLNIIIDEDRPEIYNGLRSGELIINVRSMTTTTSSLINDSRNLNLIGFDIITNNKKEDI